VNCLNIYSGQYGRIDILTKWINPAQVISHMSLSSRSHQSQQRHLKKSKGAHDEDDHLRVAVQTYGTDSWNKISALVTTRTGKQCRERWIGQLAPSVSKETWSGEEDAVLIRQHALTGNRWTVIAAQLPGRSALQVKNRWNWLMRHNLSMDQFASPCLGRNDGLPNVMERKSPQFIFDSLPLNDGLFGTAFQEFQTKMLML
jgi:hypothetical protein